MVIKYMQINMRGGKRAGAGRQKKPKLEESVTISFRILACAEPQIKEYLKNLSIFERTKLLTNISLKNK